VALLDDRRTLACVRGLPADAATAGAPRIARPTQRARAVLHYAGLGTFASFSRRACAGILNAHAGSCLLYAATRGSSFASQRLWIERRGTLLTSLQTFI